MTRAPKGELAIPAAILHPSASYRHGLAASLGAEGFHVEEVADIGDWITTRSRRVIVIADATEASVLDLRGPETTVVVLIPMLEVDGYRRALAGGADGVAHADSHPGTIAHVVRAAVAGEVVLPAEVARQLAGRPRPAEIELAGEEIAFLQRLSEGATVVQLAAEFYLAERTVRRRLQNIYLRLGAAGRAEAVKRASQLGLVD